jgi:hypothetical protein
MFWDKHKMEPCFPVNPKQDVLGQTQDGAMLSNEPKIRSSGTNRRWSHFQAQKDLAFLDTRD